MNDKSNRKPAFQQPKSGSRFSAKEPRGERSSQRNSRNDGGRAEPRGDRQEKRFSENRTFDKRTSDKPRFENRTSEDRRRFNDKEGERSERRAPRQNREGGRDDRSRDNRSSDNRNRDRDNRSRDNRERQDSATPAFVWGEREMKATKAGKNSEGSVKVMIKGDVAGEKKTGPLSPRAPEKIRKNRNEEMKIYGEAACLALFRQRPESIVRLWTNIETSHRIGKLTSYLATAKKAYHVVDNAELALVSGSEHHGGICMLVKKATPMNLEAYLKTAKLQDCVLLLDDIDNAYNVGGVIRTAAYYGVKGIVCESADKLYSAAAARVAEGAMEHIYALESSSTEMALQALKNAGYQLVAVTANKQAQPLDKVVLSDKVAFVLSETIPAQVNPLIEQSVVLSFENPLNSGLNVAVNCGVLLSRWYFR
ncbi:TrmH family RNA methyltransferase [Testudinibacter sp. TR-2022]|uniref:TrmH family RNA methyltransferase n=1 Tax=Testudinibacter sp. TR-2022 TaxID=2585029 RepID=UPI001118A591|nr:TrmH family RNA methyltransferase [Testudinibacter sp. TR-2022]TNH09082.1 rRNA methyltransferase [Pasteurellaceae bacterium Phil11]TNH24016.1 rRNA methyltransferase [Testudinibacter sp. TR-2022]TNH27174.1 rRNA methyltransferase [Testudinibacter sp. TR-2022]